MDKRRSTYKLIKGLAEGIGTEEDCDYKKQPRCRVCASPDKGLPNGGVVGQLVDELLLVPKPYRFIARVIEPLMEGWPENDRVTEWSVKRHQERHLPWDRIAAREIAERRAAERGRAMLDAKDRLLTVEALLQLIMERGYQGLAQAEVMPSPREAMAAALALRELEKEGAGDLSLAALYAELDVVITAIREEVSPDVWSRISARLDAFKGGGSSFPSVSEDPTWPAIQAEMGADE
jgi:hypothetical protein